MHTTNSKTNSLVSWNESKILWVLVSKWEYPTSMHKYTLIVKHISDYSLFIINPKYDSADIHEIQNYF